MGSPRLGSPDPWKALGQRKQTACTNRLKKKKNFANMIADIFRELQNVGLGLGASITHWSSYPRRQGGMFELDTRGWCWHGTQLERATFVGHPPQTGTRSGGCAKVGSIVQSKVVERLTEDAVDSSIGMGQRALGQRVLGGDDINEQRIGQRERSDGELRARGAQEGIDAGWRRLHRAGHAALGREGLL